MSLVKPRLAVEYHFFNDFDTKPNVLREVRSTYDGPLALAPDPADRVGKAPERGVQALDILDHIRRQCSWHIVGRAVRYQVHKTTELFVDLRRDLVVAAYGGEKIYYFVRHLCRHRFPLVRFRHVIEFFTQPHQPMLLEHRPVRPGGAVEGDTLTQKVDLFRYLGVGSTRRDDPPALTWKFSRDCPPRPRPVCSSGSTTFSKYLRVQKPCKRTPSPTSPATLSMAGPTAPTVTGGGGWDMVSGVKFGVIRVKL